MRPIPPSARARAAVRVAGAYALVAGLWIALSDRMLVGIADPALMAQVSTFKGFAFVAVTASLLYLALRFGIVPVPDESQPSRNAGARPISVVVVFLLLSLVIGVIGYLAFRVETESLRGAEAERLRGIAELKVGQIEAWLAEIRTDTRVEARSPLLREALRRWQGRPDPVLRGQLMDRFAVLREAHDYASVELFGADGGRLLADGESLAETAELHAAISQAMDLDEPLFTDLHRHGGDGPIHLAFMAAIRDPAQPGRAVLGVVAVNIDPARFLFPLIQSWPGPSATAETLLARQDGDSLVFLNELRHRQGTALNLRFPLSETAMPAVRSIIYGDGLYEGPDYRKVPVVAFARAIAGTSWRLVAKIDQAEVFRDVERLTATTAMLTLAAILVTGVLVRLIWRQQRLREALVHAEQARALTEAEARFGATFEQAAVGLAHVAPDGRWLNVNAKLCEIVGYGRDELTRLRFQDVTHPDDLAADQEAARRMLAGEAGSCRTEKRYIHKDGRVVWINLTVSLVRQPAGDPDYFVVVVEDISARKTAEARVAKLDSLYRTVSETNQAIVRAGDETALFREVCEIAHRLGDFPLVWIFAHEPAAAELVAVAAAGPAAGHFVGFRVSVDPAEPSGRGPASRAFRSGSRVVCNDFLADADTAPWHEAAARDGIRSTVSLPIARGGKVVGSLNIAGRSVGYFDPEMMEVLADMAEDLSFALDNLARQNELRRTLGELRQAREDLERRVEERTAELRQTLARAEAADRLKSTFLATMSHELRTPLNSILGFTGILLRGMPGPLNAEQTKQLGIVRASAQHLLALINDVLDISRIEAGELKVDTEAYDLRALLERVASGFVAQAAQRDLSFEVELAPELGTAVGDARRVEQVANNLLANAFKFTRHGGVRLVGKIVEGRIEIAVEDTGIGIATADQARLFQPFVQIDGGLSRAHEGTGLGLAISRRLVEAMGGEIRVVSAPGVGSTFAFTLPLAD